MSQAPSIAIGAVPKGLAAVVESPVADRKRRVAEARHKRRPSRWRPRVQHFDFGQRSHERLPMSRHRGGCGEGQAEGGRAGPRLHAAAAPGMGFRR